MWPQHTSTLSNFCLHVPMLLSIPAHYMWSTVCVIVFIHPHMPNKQRYGAGNVYENHQMLWSSATVFVTGVWFDEHLFSHLASVFLSLHESFLLSAVMLPTLSCDYSPPDVILQSLLDKVCTVVLWWLKHYKDVHLRWRVEVNQFVCEMRMICKFKHACAQKSGQFLFSFSFFFYSKYYQHERVT